MWQFGNNDFHCVTLKLPALFLTKLITVKEGTVMTSGQIGR